MNTVGPAEDYDAVTVRLLTRVVEESRRDQDALRIELHGARERGRELEGRLAFAEDTLRRVEAERQALHAQLAEIRSSLGWTLLQRTHAIKARALPPGSAVERAYQRMVRGLADRLQGK
jgi:hypothetical protein